MRTAYKFRIYPTKQQIAVLDVTLETCRHLWNDALEDRRSIYKETGKSVSYYDQQAILPNVKDHYPNVHSQVQQDVLRRLKKAFDNFFRRIREHAKEKGYPRFKAEGRYNSITYSQSGFKLEGTRLSLSKIPNTIRVFLHREIEGNVKTCTIKRDKTNRWYVLFSVEKDNPAKVDIKTVVAVDLNLMKGKAVVTSDGQEFDYPRYYRKSEANLRAAEKTLHRRKKGSKNRVKARIQVAQVSRRITNLRDEFCHQVSRKLVNSADAIIFEDLNILGMVKNHKYAKSISDVSWGKLIRYTQSKAESAGKTVVLVDPRNTSQLCSGCGEVVPKDLSVRIHNCPSCGLVLDRDYNAAQNILTRGLREIACGELTTTLSARSTASQLCESGSPIL